MRVVSAFLYRTPGVARPLAGLTLCLTLASCMGSVGDSGPGTGTMTGTGGGTGNPVDIPVTPTGPIVSVPTASTRFNRLTHQQWENTTRDLLHLPAVSGMSATFVAEPLQSAFSNNGSVLTVAQDLREDYQVAAEGLAKKVAHDPALLGALTPPAPTDAAGKAAAFVKTFGARAFRRPLTDTESSRYLALFNKGTTLFGTGDAFIDGAELVITAFLQAPSFLYRAETSSAVVNGKIPLNGYEIASRLSFGLTNTMPDDALMKAAEAKKLATRDGVIEQAQRLMATVGAQQTVADFHDQLMRMRDFESISKDAKAAPLLAQGVGADLKQEALALVKNVVFDQGKGLSELLTAPYTFGNSRVAKLYGATATTPAAGQPDPFVRIPLDPTQRAGLLTQVGFLAANGEGQTPNLIIRGVHLVRDILCLPLPPPPNMVPTLPPIAANGTNRQRVEELTKDSACSACHTAIINPMGVAFENLDGFGRFRTQEANGQAIDATGTYKLDGESFSFDGPVSLIKKMADSRAAHDCYSEHLIEYLYGRDTDDTDAARNLVSQAGIRSKNNTSVKELIVGLVATDAFTTRLP
jgi:hypothetical protein